MCASEVRTILDAVPIFRERNCVFLKDIPQPYRTEFAHDNEGTVIGIKILKGRPEPSAYSWDWRKWIEIRCRSEEWKPRKDASAVKVMDDEALEAWRVAIEKKLQPKRDRS